jgi:hypothetical protein
VEGDTFSWKDSVDAAAIKLDFSVARSPTTTTLTPFFPPVAAEFLLALNHFKNKKQ